MNVVIIEIKKPSSIKKSVIVSFCNEYARFSQEYKDSWIIIIPEKIVYEGKTDMFINSNYDISIEKLNKIAFSRLISNMEEQHPEISLIMMGAGDESKIFKIKDI